MNDKVVIGKVLKREMKSRDVNLTKLSRESGIAISTLHGWLNGVIPSGKQLPLILKLSLFWKLSVAELLFDLDTEDFDYEKVCKSEFDDDYSSYQLTIKRRAKKN